MSTESHPSQNGPREHDQPNEFGFAGGATAPQPERGRGETAGEDTAVPAGDITGAVTHAVEDATQRDSD